MTAIHYIISPLCPKAHYFQVECHIAHPASQGQQFALPAWIPGSYLLREFAKNIVEISAVSAHKAIQLTKLNKHTWQAAPCRSTLIVRYTVYAWDLSVRAAHLDQTHGFFNGTSVFLRVLGQEHLKHTVEIRRPSDQGYQLWRVATALTPLTAPAYGFGTYQANNYDELVDHPVEMGNFVLATFTAGGAQHDVAVTGRVSNLDLSRLCADLQTICAAQIAFFEPDTQRAPFQRYVFLITALGDGYGGLEHRASTALICARHQLPLMSRNKSAKETPLSSEYREFLGLASHEYFHSWNVKRIKPAVFVDYDYTQENYTSLLWIFEGFTSYYDDLFLLRTGLISLQQYLQLLAKTISSVHRTTGRFKQSVAESSFDAWIKYYRQDENAPNAIVSYYAKGSLVALALDLYIRQHSAHRQSLDDVMRALWQRYGRNFYSEAATGLGENEFVHVVRQATGVDVTQQVKAWAYGTQDLPLKKLLASAGISMVTQAPHSRPSLGVKAVTQGNDCKLIQVYEGGAAQKAGISAGDVLLALDGLRVSAQQLDTILERYAVSERINAHVFRGDQLLCFNVQLGVEPPTYSLIALH